MEPGWKEGRRCGRYVNEWGVLDGGVDKGRGAVVLAAIVDGTVASCGYGPGLWGGARTRLLLWVDVMVRYAGGVW